MTPVRLASKFAVCLVLTFGLSLMATSVSAQVVVNESNADWAIGGESGTPTFGFVLGPATPPIGTGSVNFVLPASADGAAVGMVSGAHNGLRLDAITTLSYSTYQNMAPQAVSLQFNVDYDDSDGTTSWQGRLVFEPVTIGGVLTNTWQTWDALAGTWWSTGTPQVGDAAGPVLCPQGTPCSWADVLLNYPNIAIHSTLGSVLLKGGSGWPAGWDGNADNLTLGTLAMSVTYDFETVVPVELQSFSIE